MISIQRSVILVLILTLISLTLVPQSLQSQDPVLQHLLDSVKMFTYEDPNNPSCEIFTSNEYDIWGNLICDYLYIRDNSLAELVPLLKKVYAYNMQGYVIHDSTFLWLTASQEWRDAEANEYDYNDEGKKVYIHSSEWDSQAGALQNDIKIENYYAASGDLVSTVLYGWNSGLGIWEHAIRDTFEYNVNDSLLTQLSYTWDDGLDDWEYFAKDSYEYDAGGYNTQILFERWEPIFNSWDTTMKVEISYNMVGQKEVEQYFYWDRHLSHWDPGTRWEYLYYNDGTLYADKYMPWDAGMGAFLIESQNMYTYDDYGNLLTTTNDTIDKLADEMVLKHREYRYYKYLYHEVVFEAICDQDSLEWHGSYLTTEGLHTASYTSVQGYDSLYSIYLFLNPKPEPFSISGAQNVAPGQIEIYTVPVNPDVSYGWYIINCTPLSYPNPHSIELQWSAEGESILACVSFNEFECRSDRIELVVNVQTTAIPEDHPEGISFYPNPVQSVLHLKIPDQYKTERILLLDALGHRIFEIPVTGSNMSLELDQLFPGVYILSFEGDKPMQYRIIKQ